MNEPIEKQYFNWLCAKVLGGETRNYRDLLEILFSKEFVWVIPADQHRIADGMELRQDFLRQKRSRDAGVSNVMPCSILEVLISFSERASFQTLDPAADWFWKFMANLKLDSFRRVRESDVPFIEDVLYTFTWRVYEPNGYGGLFPMERTQNDQREVEIWYQFCEYLDYIDA